MYHPTAGTQSVSKARVWRGVLPGGWSGPHGAPGLEASLVLQGPYRIAPPHLGAACVQPPPLHLHMPLATYLAAEGWFEDKTPVCV